MLYYLKTWFDRLFAEEESIIFLLLLLACYIVLATMGGMIAPILVSIVFAFFLQGGVNFCMKLGMSHKLSVWLIYLIFIGLFLAFILIVFPLVGVQVRNLINEFPLMLVRIQELLHLLPTMYPDFIDKEQVQKWSAILDLNSMVEQGDKLFPKIVSFSLSTLPNLFAVLIYCILVPILLFFFLKDRAKILSWLAAFLPSKRPLMHKISIEMNEQIVNYVRGKMIEILIVGMVSFVVFKFLGLNYAALLSLLIGLSVVIPYIGAALVTIPVLMVGLFQWGLSAEFYYMLIAYGVIQGLDGNVLVPVLFSEAVNLHPVAIIVAVIVFGGLWGFWGVFFAIPLATLIKAILNAWPSRLLNKQLEETCET